MRSRRCKRCWSDGLGGDRCEGGPVARGRRRLGSRGVGSMVEGIAQLGAFPQRRDPGSDGYGWTASGHGRQRVLPNWLRNPMAYCIEYLDGMRATMLMLNGANEDFVISARGSGPGNIGNQFFRSGLRPTLRIPRVSQQRLRKCLNRLGSISRPPYPAGQRNARGVPDFTGAAQPAYRDAAPGGALSDAGGLAVHLRLNSGDLNADTP